MNLVSVIVPCYNQAVFLDDCLESVLNQSYNLWECIIIDDGSTDNVRIVVDVWLKRDIRFKFISQPNNGLSSARNAAIRQSNGIYILPLDADDKISRNFLESMVNVFQQESNQQLKLVFPKVQEFGCRDHTWNTTKYCFQELLRMNYIVCTSLFRKVDWAHAGGYDENLRTGLEDWEFWIKLLLGGNIAKQNLEATFYYRIKSNSMSKELQKSRQEVDNVRNYIFNKHILVYGYRNSVQVYDELMKIKNFPEKELSFIELLTAILRKIMNKLKSQFCL